MLCPFGTSGIAPIYKMVVGETRCASPPPRSSRGAQRRGDPERQTCDARLFRCARSGSGLLQQPSSRGAQRRGDPEARAARLDCFATLAV